MKKIEFEVKHLESTVKVTKMKLFEAVDILMNIEGTIDEVQYELSGDKWVEIERIQIADSVKSRIKE
jgi:hypothetical protein